MLAWLVHEQVIEPHIPVFDKSRRKDQTASRVRRCRSEQWRDKAHLSL